MKKLIYLFVFLTIDFLISNLILKNTKFWENQDWENKYWRIPSKIYHHDLLPNVNVNEKWGGNIIKNIITNSIGFIDKENRIILKDNLKQKRILLIGDSFIEGSGLNYENTFAGLLDDYLGKNYEILNSAVGSYSPSIYYKKTEYYLNQGYKFDQALIFLDVSDIFDELFIKFNNKGNIMTYEERKNRSTIKKTFYFIGRLLRDNTVTFRTLNLISDKTEIIKNYLKLKFKTSKDLNKSFFKTNRDEVMFYRMTHIDRGYWTYDNKKFSQIKAGLKQSETYLEKLFELLKKNNISSTLIIYPWPTQILFGDNYHQNYWENFSKKRGIKFLSLYKFFKSEKTSRFIFDNFIYGDVHWNKNGTKIVFENVIKNIDF